jgi:hypothetical protein
VTVDALISSEELLQRLGKEEQQMKFLGLYGHAAGIRAAITVLIRLVEAGKDQPAPLDPSS